MKKFTKETLANYNGKNGRPAYIAFNGRVYDVTNNSHWLNGENKVSMLAVMLVWY